MLLRGQRNLASNEPFPVPYGLRVSSCTCVCYTTECWGCEKPLFLTNNIYLNAGDIIAPNKQFNHIYTVVYTYTDVSIAD